MLKHYSHIRMEVKRTALEAIVAKKADAHPVEEKAASLSVNPVFPPTFLWPTDRQ
jgi:hypothetical protein